MWNWIQSRGGPLILLPVELLGAWGGVTTSDYDRACSVIDEVASLNVSNGTGLVFGDEPHQMSWLALPDGGLLVRWIYAKDESDVLAAVEGVRDGDFGAAVAVFNVMPSGACMLLDAADPGYDLQGDHLLISLIPGVYTVKTAELAPDENTRVLLHRVRFG